MGISVGEFIQIIIKKYNYNHDVMFMSQKKVSKAGPCRWAAQQEPGRPMGNHGRPSAPAEHRLGLSCQGTRRAGVPRSGDFIESGCWLWRCAGWGRKGIYVRKDVTEVQGGDGWGPA